MLETVCDATQVLHTIVTCYSALITTLHLQIGKNAGAYFVENITRSFHSYYIEGEAKKSGNLLLFLAHLHNFEVSLLSLDDH